MKKTKNILLVFILTFVLSLNVFAETTQQPLVNLNKLEVHFIDVDQGDSIYIKTPKGNDILIDGGNNGYGDEIVKYLKNLKVDDIEVMIATHPDADHIGGLDIVLNNFVVESVYSPKVTHTTKTYEDFILAVKNEGLKLNEAKSGVKLNLDDVNANFIAPTKTYEEDLNDWSAVLKLDYKNNSFLFTGDATLESEKDIIASKVNLKSDVLKVGHHGANTSTSNIFLNKVNPKYAVISCGKNNKYNHPTQEIIKKLQEKKIQIFRTDLSGSIKFLSDGSKIEVDKIPTVNTSTNINTNTNNQNTNVIEMNSFKAYFSDSNPKQYSTITLYTEGIKGTPYTATFHYSSKNTIYKGTIGTPLNVKIGRAKVGFTVNVDIKSIYNGKTYNTKTSFTPKGK